VTFEEKMRRLVAKLEEHFAEGARLEAEAAKLDAAIVSGLKELGHGG
jgi:hypothetical protein